MKYLTYFLGTVVFIISSGHYECELTRGLNAENIRFGLLQYLMFKYAKVHFHLWKLQNAFNDTILSSLLEFIGIIDLFVLFVFVALRPMSTAMVIAGRSVYLTTLFPGQAWASG